MESKSLQAPKWARFLNSMILIILVILILIPFLHVLAVSFNEGVDTQKGGIGFWPRIWTIENYKEVFKQDNLLNGLMISLFRTVVGTVLGIGLMSMAAYALTVKDLPGRRFFTFFIFFTMLFSGGQVPYYLVLSQLKLTGSIWVYVIPSLYATMNILILRTQFSQLPYSVIESARIDGASEWLIFRKLVLPMSKPVLATVTLFTAVGHWNDWFAGTFYVRDANLKPLATLLQEMLTQQSALSDILLRSAGASSYAALDKITVTGQSLQMATIIVVLLPMILSYPFVQKYFVKGITVGSIKE
ncbi:carbohydrate ABC transporter permease [Eremococcus coleocola]|uniref:ABC transporter, permease protein n=1 Tax=Eremococcus coleocola ACS-139-V-Col8 TaxID=908337 RepID=E4KMK6_9LACT|nr:carbohydrate ABC transporter permease [Eremococcus coleocola]EFR31721.1 ABC transporter, permease protein [Eremococcus coleocola ACS-139-V-Col8]